MIRLHCEACEILRKCPDIIPAQKEHTCVIKDLPSRNRGTVMVYEYVKPVFFLFDRYTPGGFCKSIDNSSTIYLAHGKLSSQIFVNTMCRPAETAEIEMYKLMVEQSKYATADVRRFL